MTIAEIQDEFIASGFQFVEQVFNDGDYCNCYIRFTLTKCPHAFAPGQNRQPDVGWGRFERRDAWNMAWDWLLKWRKEQLATAA